jgi:hypothetical protein
MASLDGKALASRRGATFWTVGAPLLGLLAVAWFAPLFS